MPKKYKINVKFDATSQINVFAIYLSNKSE